MIHIFSLMNELFYQVSSSSLVHGWLNCHEHWPNLLLYKTWPYEKSGITNKRRLTSYLTAASRSSCVFTRVALCLHIQVDTSLCLFAQQFLFPNQSTVCTQVYHTCCGDMKVCMRERVPALRGVIIYLGRQDIFSWRVLSASKIDGCLIFISNMGVLSPAYYLHKSQSLNQNRLRKNKSMLFISNILKYNKYTINNTVWVCNK